MTAHSGPITAVLFISSIISLHSQENPKPQNAFTNPSGFYFTPVSCLKCLIDYFTISEFLLKQLSKAVFWIRFPYSFSHSESLLPMVFFLGGGCLIQQHFDASHYWGTWISMKMGMACPCFMALSYTESFKNHAVVH